MKQETERRQPIVLNAGQGRPYKLGPMTAIFKADGAATANWYSVSEWWLEPNAEGPHAHRHEDQDQLFYILEGTVSFLVDEQWIEATRGMFISIPQHTLHTFANRTGQRAGMLNIDVPGGFEQRMPAMVQWFEEQE